ncbi:MAG TPA: NADH-quinone oxidoreductase subunit NuoH [Fimbriimonadaceae bacterium]|jgi:NADH-quinone oxidoreductase subunit H
MVWDAIRRFFSYEFWSYEGLQNHGVWGAIARVVIVVLPILMLVPGLIWWERRLLSWMQDRIGPNRVGPFGLLQTIADGVKLFLKEDITPTAVDKLIYFTAPALALFPAFALGGTLPWGPNKYLTPIADVNIGILYVLAVSSLGVYGIVLAGYASNNKYSLMGGLRSSAQLISYELAMGMALAGAVLASGSLTMTGMVHFQEGPWLGMVKGVQNWLILTPYGFVAALIFAICAIAETNRAPFDLPEAENELIAGYHTEYSSMKFAVFFMGEYAAMFVFSGIFTAVFCGGYHALPIDWTFAGLPIVDTANSVAAGFIFLGKVAFFFSCFIWLRATLPRLRYDQLMSLGWRSLLPLAVANFMLVGVWIVAADVYKSEMAGLVAYLIGFAVMFGVYLLVKRASADRFEGMENRGVVMNTGVEPVSLLGEV